MKRAIALLFTIVYVVFTTAASWHAVDENEIFISIADHKSVYDNDKASLEHYTDDVLNKCSFQKVHKHTHVAGKRKLSRVSPVDVASKYSYINIVAATYTSATILEKPTFHDTQLYVRNRVLRI